MATVKVKFHPSSVEGKDGSVVYRVSKNKKTKSITSGIKMPERYWEKYCEMQGPCSGGSGTGGQEGAEGTGAEVIGAYARRIEEDMAKISHIINVLEARKPGYSVEDIARVFKILECYGKLLEGGCAADACLGQDVAERRPDMSFRFEAGAPGGFAEITGRAVQERSFRVHGHVRDVCYEGRRISAGAGMRSASAIAVGDAGYGVLMEMSLFGFMSDQIMRLSEAGKYGTARNYRRAFSSIYNFLKGKDIPLSFISEGMMTEYESWLSGRQIKRNTSSFYMRILRAVYNKAARLSLVEQEYPFDHVYTGIDKTRKLAISEDTLISLEKIDLSRFPSLSMARDIFMFSFSTRGMSFVDIAYLKKSDIKNGVICYARKKTGRQVTVFVEPFIKNLMKKYEKDVEGTPYVFPILSSTEPVEAFRQYQTSLGLYNKHLKRISSMIGKDVRLSSNTARHAWATIARNSNVPVSVVSAGLGHSSERTTQIYLASLENSVVDMANRDILSRLIE